MVLFLRYSLLLICFAHQMVSAQEDIDIRLGNKISWTPATNQTIPISLDITGDTVMSTYPTLIEALPARTKDNTQYDIRYYDVKEGMNSSQIVCQLQDSRGHLWFGTYGGGLTRFDGHTFIHYTTDEGLCFNIVRSLMEDDQGQIWVGTHGGGISIYDGHTFVNINKDNGLPQNRIRSITQDSQGDMWISGDNLGIVHYDGSRWSHYTTAQGLSSNMTRDVIEDQNGLIWISTGDAGLNRFNGERFQHLRQRDGLASDILRSLYEDTEGRIWVATYGGGVDVINDDDHITNYDIEQGLGSNEIWSVIQDSNDDYWISTYEGGACRYDGTAFFCLDESNGLTSNLVWNIIEDNYQNVWIATEGGGICRYTPNSFRHISEANGLSNNLVYAFQEDQDDNLFIGTLGGGIDIYNNGKLEKFQLPRNINPQRIRDFLIDREGSFWIATDGDGAIKIKDKNATIINTANGLLDNNVWSITEDHQGDIWLSTAKGICRYDGDKVDSYTTTEGLSENRQNSSFTDAQGNLWFGSIGGGVNIYDGTTFRQLTTADGLSDDLVLSFAEDHQGNIWIGTFNGGINRYNGTEISIINNKNGLDGNTIWSMTIDSNGDLWAATDKGFSKIALPIVNDNYNITTWKEKDGLKSENTNELYIDKASQLWVSTAKGLSILPLNAPKEKRVATHLSFSQLDIERRQGDFRNTTIGDIHFDSVAANYNYPLGLILPHDKDQVTFRVSSVHDLGADQPDYQYKIVEIDDDWLPPTKRPYIDYNNLPYGTYSFLARAKVGDSEWSNTITYDFEISPPWWRSWWAHLFYILTSIGIIAGLYITQLRRAKLKNQLRFEQKEADRLNELDRIKTNFFSNITHEFRTPITLILEPLRQLLSEYPDHPIKERLELAKNNSETLLTLVNQLLDLSKIDSGQMKLDTRRGNIMETIFPLFRSFIPLAEKKSLLLTMDGVHTLSDSHFDGSKLEIIINNLLSNAIKFTIDGKVNLNVAIKENELSLTVSDTGRGMSAAHLSHIYDRFYQIEDPMAKTSKGTGIGLALTKDIVTLMGGTINVQSEVGQGTSFQVMLPMDFLSESHTVEEATVQHVGIVASTITTKNNLSNSTSVNQENESLILLIEDNEELRTFISQTLASHFSIITAVDGAEGCNTARERIPDLVVSDVMMPGKDGYQVTSELKQDPLTAHIPIILLTAKSSIDSKIEGWTTGADAYLTKPFHSEELIIRIKKLIEARKKLQSIFINSNNNFATKSIEELINPIDQKFLNEITAYIIAHINSEALSVELLAQSVFMSRTQLFRKLKAVTGLTPTQFIKEEKFNFAFHLYNEGETNLSILADMVGYKDEKNFAKSWKEKYGS